MSVDSAIIPPPFVIVTHTQGEKRQHGKYCSGSQFDALVLKWIKQMKTIIEKQKEDNGRQQEIRAIYGSVKLIKIFAVKKKEYNWFYWKI